VSTSQTVLSCCELYFEAIATTFKNQAFRDEREQRIVHISNADQRDRLRRGKSACAMLGLLLVNKVAKL